MYRVHFEQIHPGIWDIATGDPNPTLLVTVGLHPDEAGGVFGAALELVRALLVRGRVIMAHCFPEQRDSRFVGEERRDPNRAFIPEVLQEGDDAFRRRMRLLAECADRADLVLDLHRYSKDDGGPVAFPYDDRGVELAVASGVPMIVTDLVAAVEGALALYAARRGKVPLVVEVGPRGHERASDRNTLSVLLSVLRAQRMVAPEDRVSVASGWPEGPKVFRLLRAIHRAELTPDILDQIASLGHMAPLPPLLADEVGLPIEARLLMVNPVADPAAYACLPSFEHNPAGAAGRAA